MEKYSKAVSEMYSQFKQGEAHPLEKYIGRLANCYGEKMEVVGYSYNELADGPLLIVDASGSGGGWSALEPFDVVSRKCESYWYVNVDDLMD